MRNKQGDCWAPTSLFTMFLRRMMCHCCMFYSLQCCSGRGLSRGVPISMWRSLNLSLSVHPVARDPRTRAVWTCPEQQGGTLKIFYCGCFGPYLRKMDPFWLRFFNASGLKPSSRKNFCISRMAILVSICCILRVVFCNKVLFARRSPKIFDEGTGKGCCSPDMLRI